MTRDGRTCVSGHMQELVVWDVETTSVKCRVPVRGAIVGLVLRPDERTALFASEFAGINILDIATGQVRPLPYFPVNQLTVVGTGSEVVAASNGFSVFIYDCAHREGLLFGVSPFFLTTKAYIPDFVTHVQKGWMASDGRTVGLSVCHDGSYCGAVTDNGDVYLFDSSDERVWRHYRLGTTQSALICFNGEQMLCVAAGSRIVWIGGEGDRSGPIDDIDLRPSTVSAQRQCILSIGSVACLFVIALVLKQRKGPSGTNMLPQRF